MDTPGSIEARPTQLWLAASVLATVIALTLQASMHINADTSWLLYVAERTLDGAVPYRDILETNPPASFLIYMPAVALAQLVGAAPETVTIVLTVMATGFSLALSDLILRRAGLLDPADRPALLFAAAVLLLVLPLSSFAQREHLALLASLPLLAATAARANGGKPRLWETILAGVGGGVVIAVKPVFGLAFVGPVLLCWHDRSWRSVAGMVEAWIASAVAIAYAGAVFVFWPDYAVRVLPLVVAIYVPARLDLVTLVAMPVFWLWFALMVTFWWVRTRADRPGLVLIVASAGFEAALFIQGKGFVYHCYPAFALAGLACAMAFVREGRAEGRILRWPRLAFAPANAVLIASLFAFSESNVAAAQAPGLFEAVAAISPHPRLLTISGSMHFGRAFARELGGEWVGSTPVAWITYFASAITPQAESDVRFAEAIRMERQRYAEDIVRNQPDVILVQGDGWMRWTRQSPALVEALNGYDRLGRYGSIIALRRSEAAAASASPRQASNTQPTEAISR